MPIGFGLILNHLPGWALVLFRLTGIFVFTPVFGSSAVPRQVKILLALGLSFCVYPVLIGSTGPSAAIAADVLHAGIPLWSLSGIVATELLIGVAIGFGASLPLMGMQLGGRVIDQQLGMGLAGIYNPELNEQTGVISEVLFLLALTLFIIMDGHRVVLAVLLNTFHNIPLGGYAPGAGLTDLMVGLVHSMTDLGIRIAAPILCLMFLQTVAIGFIAKTVPQMNILSIGFVLRIGVGVTVLTGAMASISQAFRLHTVQMLDTLMRAFNT